MDTTYAMTSIILRHTDFEPLLNETFHLHYGDNERLPVTLTQVRPWGPQTKHPQDESLFQPFALMLQSTLRDQYLPQGNFILSHPQLGEHVLFIVPHAPNAVGIEYEITFS
jgi:hypothetical protein